VGERGKGATALGEKRDPRGRLWLHGCQSKRCENIGKRKPDKGGGENQRHYLLLWNLREEIETGGGEKRSDLRQC